MKKSATAQGDERLGYWLFASHLLTVWGLALSNLLLGLTLLWSLRHGKELWRRWERVWPRFLPLGLYLMLLLASIATSLDPVASLRDLGEVFSVLTLPLALLWVRSERDVRRICGLLLLMVVGLALHGLWQYFFTEDGPISSRIRGLFSHYMTFAGVLLIGLSLTLASLTSEEGIKNPRRWFALLMISTTLVLTLTRGAWVAALVVLALVLWLQIGRRSLGYLAMLLLAGAMLYPLAPADWQGRIDSVIDLRDPSNYDRLCMAEAASYMISERPFFGIGPRMVSKLYPIYRHPTAPRYTVPHLHNTFLQLAAERGLLSLAAYLWLMVASGHLAYRAYQRTRGSGSELKEIHLGVFLAIVGFNVAGLFEANWSDAEVQRLTLFLLAVPFCLEEVEDRA